MHCFTREPPCLPSLASTKTSPNNIVRVTGYSGISLHENTCTLQHNCITRKVFILFGEATTEHILSTFYNPQNKRSSVSVL